MITGKVITRATSSTGCHVRTECLRFPKFSPVCPAGIARRVRNARWNRRNLCSPFKNSFRGIYLRKIYSIRLTYMIERHLNFLIQFYQLFITFRVHKKQRKMQNHICDNEVAQNRADLLREKKNSHTQYTFAYSLTA